MNTYLNIKKYSDDASQYTVQSGTNLCVLWWCPDFVQLVFFSWLILACIWHLLTLHSFKQHERLDQWLGVWVGGPWGGGVSSSAHMSQRRGFTSTVRGVSVRQTRAEADTDRVQSSEENKYPPLWAWIPMSSVARPRPARPGPAPPPASGPHSARHTFPKASVVLIKSSKYTVGSVEHMVAAAPSSPFPGVWPTHRESLKDLSDVFIQTGSSFKTEATSKYGGNSQGNKWEHTGRKKNSGD